MKSESIKELAMALSKAQGQFNHAKKDTKNEFFRSQYADLASVIDAAKKQLADNGLSVVQVVDMAESGDVVLETILMHISGEYISGKYPIRPAKQDPQAVGSAITYARRYAFSAMTGIAADDDDGNAASQSQKEPAKKPPDEKKQPESDGKDYSKVLNKAENLQQLSEAWETIPKSQQFRCIQLKDGLKNKFMESK